MSSASSLRQHSQLDADPEPALQPVDAGSVVEVRRAAMITAAFGIAHAVLLLAAFWLLRSRTVSPTASDAEVVAFYSDSDNRRRIVVACLYLIPFSGMAFIWFIVALRMWTSGSARRLNLLLANVQFAAGLIYVALIIVAGAAYSVVAATYLLEDGPISPEFARQFPRFGTLLFLTLAMRMAAVVVFTVSTIGRSTGILPRWFGVVGMIVGVTLLISASLNPFLILVFPVWLTVLSIILMLRARQVPTDAVLPPLPEGNTSGTMFRRLADPSTGTTSTSPSRDTETRDDS